MVEVFDDKPEKVEVEIMPAGNAMSALVRGEIDIQIATAKAFPRNVAKFKDKTLSLAKLNKKVAESCMYKLPRGGKVIDGESIRFAEIAATSWGNCRVAGRVVGIEERHVHAQGAFLDLESNYACTVDVFRRITDKNGNRYGDDMIMTTAMAAASIARRNAILSGIPRSYLKEIYQEVKAFATDGKGRSLNDERNAAFQYIQSKGVSERRILDLLGKGSIDEVTFEDIADLRGLSNAVKDGMTSWKEAFPDLSNYAPEIPKQSAQDILNKVKNKKSKENAPEGTGKNQGTDTSPPTKEQPEGKDSKQNEPPGKESSQSEETEENKPLTPKQKTIKLLLPIVSGNPSGFAKACEKALGGKPDMTLAPEVILDNLTHKELLKIEDVLQGKEEEKALEQPESEDEGTDTGKTEETAAEGANSKQNDPSEAPAPKPEESAEEKPSEEDSGNERAELAEFIKNHASDEDEKKAIIADVLDETSDEVVADMVKNPEKIEDIAYLRSVKNILEMMG